MKLNKSNLAVFLISITLVGCGGGNGDFSIPTNLPDLTQIDPATNKDTNGAVENDNQKKPEQKPAIEAKDVEKLRDLAHLSEYSINNDIYGYYNLSGFSNKYMSDYGNFYNSSDNKYSAYYKLFKFEETDDGLVAKIPGANGGAIFVSKSIKRNPDGSVDIIMTNSNDDTSAVKIILGAGQVDNFNSYYSYMDYGVWQYGTMQNGEFVLDSSEPVYVISYKKYNSTLTDLSKNYRSDVMDDVVFTGKTNAIKTLNGVHENLSGDVKLTLGFGKQEDFDGNRKSFVTEPKVNVELSFDNWKKIDFDYGSNVSNNLKVDGNIYDEASVSFKLDLGKSGEHTAAIGYNADRVTVGEYDKAMGIYKFENIPDENGNANIIGGFVAKAIDADNVFNITPSGYSN